MALKHRYEIHTLAGDLGIENSSDPVRAILRLCERRTHAILRDYPECNTLAKLLEVMEARLDTEFVEVRTDDELRQVQERYSLKGETALVCLHDELADDVYGITFRRTSRKSWERQFVSIIDCRGEKQFRSYFTKWHELGHLLVLTDQRRLKFLRTHAAVAEFKDPEEALVDIIAGRVGFLARLVRAVAKGRASFEAVEDVRLELCPEASKESAVIGIAAAWPTPCLVLRAGMATKKGERAVAAQAGFEFHPAPQPALRAVSAKPNDAARGTDLAVFPNMRVPERSIIHKVFIGELYDGEADEDLSWWATSGGQQLPALAVRVGAQALPVGPEEERAVQAILTPL